VPSYAVQDVQRIHSHVSLGAGEANQGIVKKDIKPLLIEIALLPNQVSLTCVDDFIVLDVILEILDNLDSQV
jgi:hypothetical protein